MCASGGGECDLGLVSPRVGWVRRKDGDDSACGTLTGDRWTQCILPAGLSGCRRSQPHNLFDHPLCQLRLSQIRPESKEAAELQAEPLPAPWACQPLICSCSYKYLQIPAAEEQDSLCQLGLPSWKLAGGVWQVRTMGGRVGLLWRDRCSGLLSSQLPTLQSLAHDPSRSRNISHSSG